MLRTKHRHVYSETSRQAGLEFVCIFGHDAIVKPTALGPVANTDTKLLIYGLFQKGRVIGFAHLRHHVLRQAAVRHHESVVMETPEQDAVQTILGVEEPTA